MSEMIKLKKRLYEACQAHLDKRKQSIRSALKEAQDSVNEETKSSAGDKHETGRAMMQLETEQLSGQLREVMSEEDRLRSINIDRTYQKVEAGALVITDSLRLFFAIGAGNLQLDGEEYFALSLQTPLGQAAQGKQVGDTFSLQNRQYKIIQLS